MSLLMSPYGLMIGFSVLVIFVFPKMKVRGLGGIPQGQGESNSALSLSLFFC